jgi:outer membrane receptor protein involved in Fe transport
MHRMNDRRLRRCAFVLLIATGTPGYGQSAETEELLVTASRVPRGPLELIGNTAALDTQAIRLTSHQHIYELGTRTAGTWLSRGSGQEHLTAIRSPVLTGPGACGAFLTLEDSIPTRPTGFCNVNQLFEIPTELVQRSEVLRGPANALYGSNGLHGSLNFLLPEAGANRGWRGDIEAGPDDYRRGRGNWSGSWGDTGVAAGLLADYYGGFQNDSGYEQQKGYFKLARDLGDSKLRVGFSASNLDQETAGFIRGQDAYKDPELRRINPNPEAFRQADSQRAYLRWSQNRDTMRGRDLRAYLRRSDMEFLQHFLPGQPLEENGQLSGGLMFSQWQPLGNGSLTWGLDTEYMQGFLRETQFQDLGPDSNRPPGKHYDYGVDSLLAAAYAQLDLPLTETWTLRAGLRIEYLRYDYDNRMLDGNTREDGSECTSGCLFFRPADRSDDFAELAPNFGLRYRIDDDSIAWLTLTRGFRAPQATELYRLQSGQAVGDLQPEIMDSIEIGWRRETRQLSLEASAFAMRKDNYIFRDAEGFNVSDGNSEHVGAELQASWRAESGWFAALAGTWVRHTYAFDRNLSFGETIRSGDDVDTAPRTLGSARIGYDRGPLLTELEWLHQGAYYLNASNTARYDGHDLANLRVVWRPVDNWSLALRINNLADTRYADRADFAFGSYRYFPGREREAFVQLAYRSF